MSLKPAKETVLERFLRYVSIDTQSNEDSDTYPSTDKQYAGWPIKINQNENYEREAVAYLPTLKINGMTDPVVQIINEATSEIISSQFSASLKSKFIFEFPIPIKCA